MKVAELSLDTSDACQKSPEEHGFVCECVYPYTYMGWKS